MELNEQALSEVEGIVAMIRERYELADIDSRIRSLVREYGEDIKEMVTDLLNADNPDTYCQTEQDRLNLGRTHAELRKTEMGAKGRRTVWVISSDATSYEVADSAPDLLGILTDLVRGDFSRIPAEAKLNRVEHQVWNYWTQGMKVKDIATRVQKGRYCAERYTVSGIRKMLYRIQERVLNLPSLGWRTTFAEDRKRGKNACPPEKISWIEVVRGEDSINRDETCSSDNGFSYDSVPAVSQ